MLLSIALAAVYLVLMVLGFVPILGLVFWLVFGPEGEPRRAHQQRHQQRQRRHRRDVMLLAQPAE